jgi:tRNA U34 5-methylaminomethyl-2-thiouridine-forming methyltransferase MnmC
MSSFFASVDSCCGFPFSHEFQDRYYLEHLGLYETQCIYLENQQIFENNLQHQGPFVVAEIGFGSALNFLAFYELWLRGKRPKGPLIYISYEKHPLHPRDLAQSLEPWRKNLPLSIDKLLEKYRCLTEGVNLFFFNDDKIILILLIGEASEQLDLCHFKAHHWMLDGFAPSKNASAWSPMLLEQIGRLSAPQATLATFTAASAVRRGLESSGWMIDKVKGFGSKRHRLKGIFRDTRTSDCNAQPVTVFGAGIAGRSFGFFYDWLGGQAQVIDCGHLITSNVPYAYSFFNPRQQWDAEQIFNAQTHQFSGHFYRELGLSTLRESHTISEEKLPPRLKKRFDSALQDRRFSEILQKNGTEYHFPIGFSLNGADTLTSLSVFSGTHPITMTFDESLKLYHQTIAADLPLLIATSHAASSFIKTLPEPLMLRGELYHSKTGWSDSTHERYCYQLQPRHYHGTEHFVGFRATHSSHRPLFGKRVDSQIFYSIYHGSRGFTSAPWCGLILALEALNIFIYKYR